MSVSLVNSVLDGSEEPRRESSVLGPSRAISAASRQGGDFYKLRCKYFDTHGCVNWVNVKNTACALCIAQGRDIKETLIDKSDSKPRLSKEDVEKLEKVFQENPKPSAYIKAQLADQLELKRPRINNWFQNRRARAKQERRQEEYEAQRVADAAVSELRSPDEDTPSNRLDEYARRNASAPTITQNIMQGDGNAGAQEHARNQKKSSSYVVRKLNDFRNMLSDCMQPRVPSGYVRVSWTCRCGKRLHIEVPKNRQEAGLAFAQEASGPSNVDSVSCRGFDDDSSSTSSSTQTFARRSLSQSSNASLDSPPTALSIGSDAADPFIPAGTKKYLLLCVNSGIRRISLANVDVTNAVDDEEIFKKLQEAYRNLRGQRGRNPFIKPKTMHYIKFQLLHLQKSKECVRNYESNSIPSRTEIYRQEYAFSPCPPALGDLPIPPALFMHAFLDPGDHMGSMAVEMLPKKLRAELSWNESVNSSLNVPIGWGFYIIEGLDWYCVTWCVMITTLVVTLLTICWSALMQDVQGGTGIGQYCIAVLAVMVSAVLLATEGA